MYNFMHCIIGQKDFISTTIDVLFSPDESEKSVHVPIMNDTDPERSEYFYGHLIISHPTESEHLLQLTTVILRAKIEILYNDCKDLIGDRAAQSIKNAMDPLNYFLGPKLNFIIVTCP